VKNERLFWVWIFRIEHGYLKPSQFYVTNYNFYQLLYTFEYAVSNSEITHLIGTPKFQCHVYNYVPYK